MHFDDNGLVYCSEATAKDFGVGIILDRKAGPAITITGVSSSRSDGGARLGDAIVVDVPDNRVGTSPWPVPDDWGTHREPAIGAVVPSATQVDLVVQVVRQTSTGGSVGTISIEYMAEGRKYEANTHLTAKLERTC